MCNASPGHRCDGDSYTTVENSVDRYSQKIAEFTMMERPDPKDKTEYKKWRAKKDSLAKEKESLAEKVDFYYSTNKSEEDGAAQQRKMTAMLKNKLNPKEIASLGINQSVARRTGHHINGFHTLFTESLKNDPNRNHLDNTRKMFNGGFKDRRDELLKNANNKYAMALDKIEYENPDKDVTKLNNAARQAHFKEAKSIRKAYDHAQEEARVVVRKDCEDNSQGYRNSITKADTAYLKNTDGTFTVHTVFEVKGKNFEEVVRKNNASFKGEEMQATYEPVEGQPNTYKVRNKYVYKGGEEKLDAVTKHHENNIFKGPPLWREVLAQTRYIEREYHDETPYSSSRY